MNKGNKSSTSDGIGDITGKLAEWLGAEGYPLEYFTAEAFKAAGFQVRQGEFVRREPGGPPREVDVIADMAIDIDHRHLRVSTVIECKWSGDKPVVIFTDPDSHMMASACISQTIASDVGDALVWLLRGDENMKSLAIFDTPDRPGFGGRQAFGGKDNFYAAMAGVTGACVDLVSETDRDSEDVDYIQEYGSLSFPVIVIDGRLFEAIYDSNGVSLDVKEVKRSRVHWRGSPSYPLISTIDVITRGELADFARERANDVEMLIALLKNQLEELIKAFDIADRSVIFGDRGASGRGAAPRLIQVLANIKKKYGKNAEEYS